MFERRTSMARQSRSDATTRRDHYQEVTDRIVEALEAATLPWRRPWNPALAGRDGRPRNATTGRLYNGINVLLLALSPLAWGSGDHRWCSYKQAEARGWQVRKGEHGTRIFFFRKLDVEARECPEPGSGTGTRQIGMLRPSTIFHASQIDGIPARPGTQIPKPTWEPPEVVRLIATEGRAEIRIGGPQAFYSPLSDHIQMPPPGTFTDEYAWSAVLLHEMAHWSGAATRLNRDLSGRFGTAAYAEEELRAELASAFLGNALGLPCDIPNHASYLQSWLKKLREDKREIFRAAAAAQRIADYLLAFHPEMEGEAEDADTADPEEHLPQPLAA
jgi:antirestriction protein ArdC